MTKKDEIVSIGKEEWRPIPGYEGLYKISNSGVVVGVKSARFRQDHTMSPQLSKGYLRLGLSDKRGYRRYYFIHKLVAISFIPNGENLPQANHIDGNKVNNHVSNLEWCTAQQNSIHAVKNGLRVAVAGERCGQAKLTAKKVRQIRNSLLPGIELAKKFSVSKASISLIKSGKNWRHVV